MVRYPLCLIGCIGAFLSAPGYTETPAASPPFVTIGVLQMECSTADREAESIDDAEDLARCQSFVQGVVDTYFIDHPGAQQPLPGSCVWNKMTTVLVERVRALPTDSGYDLATPAAKWLGQELEIICRAAS